MLICKQCGAIYLKDFPKKCDCGNDELEETQTIELSEYVCENCKSQYRRQVSKCENCGSDNIKLFKNRKIIEAPDNYIETKEEIVGNSFLEVIFMIKFSCWIFVFIISVCLLALFGVDFVKYRRPNFEYTGGIFILLVFIFLLFIINVYEKSKKNYYKELSDKKSKWILLKNIDYELLPVKTSKGLKYRIIGKFLTISNVSTIKVSKELFEDSQGEFDMLINLNNMNYFKIGKDLLLDDLKNVNINELYSK